MKFSLLDYIYKYRNIITPLYLFIFLFAISPLFENTVMGDDSWSILSALTVGLLFFGFILNPFFNKLTKKINDQRKVFLWQLLFLSFLVILGVVYIIISMKIK